MQASIVVLMSIVLLVLLVIGIYIVSIRKELGIAKFRLLIAVVFASWGIFVFIIGSLCR